MSTTDSEAKKATEDGLIPGGFDPDKARRQQSTTPKSDRPKCPYCGSVSINRKTSRNDHPQRKPGAFRCENCSEHFDEPEREKECQSNLARFGGGRR